MRASLKTFFGIGNLIASTCADFLSLTWSYSKPIKPIIAFFVGVDAAVAEKRIRIAEIMDIDGIKRGFWNLGNTYLAQCCYIYFLKLVTDRGLLYIKQKKTEAIRRTATPESVANTFNIVSTIRLFPNRCNGWSTFATNAICFWVVLWQRQVQE